jgi:RimJ/RimL family protein N-acetyltransferase
MVKADLQPTLVGDSLLLRPLIEDDWEAMYAVASDPLLWEAHPARDRYKEPVFRKYFAGAMASRGALTVIDRTTGKIIGGSRYANFVPERNEIEIGWSFIARDYWGGMYNREMKSLMLTHAFRFFDSIRFNIGATNVRSRRAIEKIGARLDGKYIPEAAGGVPPVLHVIYRLNRDEARAANMLLGVSDDRDQVRT